MVLNLIEGFGILALAGFLVGFISGLVGIGGGMLFVPIFWIVFPILGIKETLIVKSSVATSAACMTVTSFTSAYHHIKAKYFNKKIFKNLLVGAIPGVIIGASLTSLFLPPKIVKVFFAIFLAIMAYKTFKGKSKGKAEAEESSYNVSFKNIVIIGFFAGLLAGMLGVGGGALITPMLHNFCHVPIKEAMATNTGVVFLNSLTSSLSYIIFGIKNTHLPYFLGYIYLPALFIMVPFLIMGTKLGVKLMHNTHPDKLRKIFAVILFLVALNVIYKTIFK